MLLSRLHHVRAETGLGEDPGGLQAHVLEIATHDGAQRFPALLAADVEFHEIRSFAAVELADPRSLATRRRTPAYRGLLAALSVCEQSPRSVLASIPPAERRRHAPYALLCNVLLLCTESTMPKKRGKHGGLRLLDSSCCLVCSTRLLSTDQEVVGSNPSRRANSFNNLDQMWGRRVCTARRVICAVAPYRR
jgi:hypothetical protein